LRLFYFILKRALLIFNLELIIIFLLLKISIWFLLFLWKSWDSLKPLLVILFVKVAQITIKFYTFLNHFLINIWNLRRIIERIWNFIYKIFLIITCSSLALSWSIFWRRTSFCSSIIAFSVSLSFSSSFYSISISIVFFIFSSIFYFLILRFIFSILFLSKLNFFLSGRWSTSFFPFIIIWFNTF
jgi:hypothetical protein